MIGVPRGVHVYAYAEPCDMRKSFNTLAAIVTEILKKDVLEGDVFLFVGKDRKRAKVLYFDGTGMCVLAKRLDAGRFAAPWKRSRGKCFNLTLAELALFIEGSDAIGKLRLSPPLLRRAHLGTRWPEKKKASA